MLKPFTDPGITQHVEAIHSSGEPKALNSFTAPGIT